MAGVIARVFIALAGLAFIAGFVAWPLLDDWRWIVVGVAVAVGTGVVAAAFGASPADISPKVSTTKTPSREGPGNGVAP